MGNGKIGEGRCEAVLLICSCMLDGEFSCVERFIMMIDVGGSFVWMEIRMIRRDLLQKAAI